MYEDLTINGLKRATVDPKDSDETHTLDDAEIERVDERQRGPWLVINGIEEGPYVDVYVDLISGDLNVEKQSKNAPFPVEDTNVSVDDGELTATIERSESTITVVVDVDGEVTENTGADLDQFGIDF